MGIYTMFRIDEPTPIDGHRRVDDDWYGPVDVGHWLLGYAFVAPSVGRAGDPP